MSWRKIVLAHPGSLAFCWAVLILVLCAMPGKYVPSAWWMDLLSFDKLVHAALFFILGALILVVSARGNWPALPGIALLVLAALYGLALEFMQASLFEGRSFEIQDAVADAAGVIIASLFRKPLIGFVQRGL